MFSSLMLFFHTNIGTRVFLDILDVFLGTFHLYTNFLSQVPVIGRSWFSCFPLDPSVFKKHIAPSRSFCVYEEVHFKPYNELDELVFHDSQCLM